MKPLTLREQKILDKKVKYLGDGQYGGYLTTRERVWLAERYQIAPLYDEERKMKTGNCTPEWFYFSAPSGALKSGKFLASVGGQK